MSGNTGIASLRRKILGAHCLLVDQANAASLVAFVQTADALHDLFFTPVGGVLAFIFDRLRLLMVVQVCLISAVVALTGLTLAGHMTRPLLLLFTFVLVPGPRSRCPPTSSHPQL